MARREQPLIAMTAFSGQRHQIRTGWQRLCSLQRPMLCRIAAGCG